MQRNDVTGVLVERVVLPALVDQGLDIRTRVVDLDRSTHLAGCVRVVWRRYNTLLVMFRVIGMPIRQGMN